MIQHRSMLKVADNSGAKSLMVIQILNGSRRKFGFIGDVLNCVVRDASPTGQVKESDIVKAVLVRSRKEFRRHDGSYISFAIIFAMLFNNFIDKNPLGT